MEDDVKVTIVTVVYNGAEHLEQTIQSVINQSYTNIEYIIIDGGSTDKTLEIIEKFKDHISFWVSEPDNGIYDAMNKGLTHATGKWVNFMNSGDIFFDKEVLKAVAQYSVSEEYDLIYGNSVFFKEKEEYIIRAKTNKYKINLNPICHQSVFIKRKAHPLFDLNYKLCADHNLIYDFVRQGRVQYVPLIISKVLMGGVSSDIRKTRKEKLEITLHKGSLRDKILGYIFYIYCFVKQYAKEFLLLFFPYRFFLFIRRLKNNIEF